MIEAVKTENVFEGTPDDRQAGEIKPSLFRPRYRALSVEEKALHDNIKTKAEELIALFDGLPAGRYNSLSRTALEESIMWAIKGLTA